MRRNYFSVKTLIKPPGWADLIVRLLQSKLQVSPKRFGGQLHCLIIVSKRFDSLNMKHITAGTPFPDLIRVVPLIDN